jgi:hypothetical protein
MDSAATNPRRQAHELIDRMEPGQISAVVSLLQVILDPASRRHVHASGKREPVSEEEAFSIAKAWLDSKGIPDEQVLAEFDLKAEDFKQVDTTAPEAHTLDK